MKMVDYIVVGTGLAGMAFIQTLKQNSKSFVVFDDASQQSSSAAAGMYNPVILKRFTKVWKAKEQLALALPFYSTLEAQLNVTINYPLQLRRRFASIEEQNNWLVASDDLATGPFMSSTFLNNDSPHIDALLGFGEVLSAGRIDTNTLLNTFKVQLAKEQLLNTETFDYRQLKLDENQLSYNTIKAKHIVFAEGFGVKRNPYFSSVPLNGTKGELLTIHAPDLKIDYAIKSSVFVIPIENDHYLVGSTYNWDDKTNQPTEKAKQELVAKLRTFIKCNFSITDHWAGIRPTVPDRRPLVGQHSQHRSLYILNGLGTRGVMIAPYVAEELFNFIENGEPLDNEINIIRFTS